MKIAVRVATAAFIGAVAMSGSAFAAGPVMKPTPTPAPTAPPPSPWTAPAAAAATPTESATAAVTGPGHMEAVTYRPEGKSLGIGAGWTFPTQLGTPNT